MVSVGGDESNFGGHGVVSEWFGNLTRETKTKKRCLQDYIELVCIGF